MRIPAAAADLARYRAIERKQKEMVAECEKAEHHRCQVAAFDGGLRYVLVDSLELPDVRLVYAPPRAVGDYGGEVDNWSWPRHVGDFALLRVYAGPDGQPAPKGEANVPSGPRHFFPVAARGIEPGGFVMVAGYPGQTFRSYTEAEMRERAELFYPRRAELYRVWIDMMEAASKQDDTARIALADRIKGLANNEKNSRGQVDGIRRGRILERKTAAEKEILAWAAQRPEQQEAVAAHDELARRIAERRATWERDFLLTQMKSGPKPLELALTLARWAGEKAKPDLEREPEYQERNRERLGERLEREQKRLHPPTEAALLTDLPARFAARAAGRGAPGPREPLGGPAAQGRAGRLPGRRGHHGGQLREPGGQRPGRAGGGELRPRLGERGQRLRLQPGRGPQHQRGRALHALVDGGPPGRGGGAAAGGDGDGRPPHPAETGIRSGATVTGAFPAGPAARATRLKPRASASLRTRAGVAPAAARPA